MEAVELRSPAGVRRRTRVGSCRVSGHKLIADFEDVRSREAARDLTGWEVWVERKYASALHEDEFYLADLYDAGVFQDGTRIGTILGVMAGGAGDLLEVEPEEGGKAFYVPFLKRFVTAVDVQARRVELKEGNVWQNNR